MADGDVYPSKLDLKHRGSDAASLEEAESIPLLGSSSSSKNNPFLDPDVADHWREVYERAKYECRHVFDPSLSWTEEEEKDLVSKIDWRICSWAVRVRSTCGIVHP